VVRVRYTRDLPALSLEQICSWAAAHERRTGRRPLVLSGAIPEAPGETWAGINQVLELGRRGLPRGSSLYRLLRAFRESQRREGQPATNPNRRLGRESV
jgi:hypothetical protein